MSEHRDRVIRASEIGRYIYCAHAWWLGSVRGLPSSRHREMAAGEVAHHRHPDHYPEADRQHHRYYGLHHGSAVARGEPGPQSVDTGKYRYVGPDHQQQVPAAHAGEDHGRGAGCAGQQQPPVGVCVARRTAGGREGHRDHQRQADGRPGHQPGR